MRRPPVAIVLRALGLGDALAGVPALRALRTAIPEHRILLAAPPAPAALLLEAGIIDGVVPAAGLAPIADAPHRPQLAVNMHGSGPESHRVLLELAPEELLAFAAPALGLLGPPWRDDEHERERWCRLITSRFGVSADPDDVRLAPPHGIMMPRGLTIIHPSAAHEARRWPVARWAEVARNLAADGHEIAITGVLAERQRALAVAHHAGLPEECVLAGRTGVIDLAALIAAARVVVAADSGPAHLASAYGVPSVVLFGPTPPQLWGPPKTGPHTTLWYGSGSSNALATTVDDALLLIQPDAVISAVRATV